MMECPSAVMPVMCFFFRVITSPRPTNGKKVRCTAFFCVEPQQRRGGRRKTEATQGRPLASLMKNQDKQRASHVRGCVRTRSMSCAVRGARVRGEREARREHGSNAPQDDDDERRESVCVKEQHQRTSRFRFVCRCHLSVVAFSGFRPFFFIARAGGAVVRSPNVYYTTEYPPWACIPFGLLRSSSPSLSHTPYAGFSFHFSAGRAPGGPTVFFLCWYAGGTGEVSPPHRQNHHHPPVPNPMNPTQSDTRRATIHTHGVIMHT